MLFTQEYIDFVRENATADPSTLRLRHHGDARPWVPLAINNIAALKKKRKFQLNGDVDLTPAVIPFEVSAQQATSAQVALLHANLAGNALNVLDMTFGLGMDARLMAMDSQRRILGFDLKEELVEAARVNFKGFPNVEIRQGDSVKFLEEYEGEPFDLIFIDPARRGEEGQRLYNLHDCRPDLTEILPLIRRHSRRLMAKLSPMLDVTQTIRDLPGISSLHIVEEGGECKELLAIVNFTDDASQVEIVVDRLSSGKLHRFSFTRDEERESAESAAASRLTPGDMPKVGEYLLEPSAAAMKASPFNLLASRFSAPSLHPNTHLYISPIPVEDFPGTSHEIVGVFPLSSSNIKRMNSHVKKADIAVRNLKGFTPDSLRKRMKIAQGGDHRLYAVTAATPEGDIPLLILTRI